MKKLSEQLQDALPTEPTPEQYQTWRASPVTQWIAADLHIKYQMLLEDAMSTGNSEMLAYFRGLMQSTEDFIDFMEKKDG